MFKLIGVLPFVLVFAGCVPMNPLGQEHLTRGFADRAVEVNDEYNQQLNAQILKNILRARDRQSRRYTTLSALKLTPQASAKNSVNGADLQVVQAASKPWLVLSGGREVTNSNNLELSISPTAVGADKQAVYRQPIDVSTFRHYYDSGWPKDVVANLLIDRIAKVLSPSPELLDKILTYREDFFVFASGQNLHYCFSEDDCFKVRLDEKKVEDWATGACPIDLSAYGRNAPAIDYNTFVCAAPDHLTATSETQDINQQTVLNVLAETNGATTRLDALQLTCQLEDDSVAFMQTGTKLPKKHEFYRCSRSTLSGRECLKRDKDGACEIYGNRATSTFVVLRDHTDSALNGIYSITLNSIDNTIYKLGESLRTENKKCADTGLATCTGSRMVQLQSSGPKKSVPLFSITTLNDLQKQKLANCAPRFSAKVRHHGTTFLAGPPQVYHPLERDRGAAIRNTCRFQDRSATALTLISELIELKQVPAELNTSNFLITN